jgi:hypothetical protein
MEVYTSKRSNKLEIDESQNFYHIGSDVKSRYVEKEVIVEEMDDCQFSDKKVP